MRLMFEKISEHRYFSLLLQIIKFGIVGGINTVISLLVYYCVVYFDTELYLVGSIVGFAVSTLNAYVLNSRFVFFSNGDKEKNKKIIIRTYLAYTFGLGVQTVLLYLQVDILELSEMTAPILALFVTVPLNYITNKFWVHRV